MKHLRALAWVFVLFAPLLLWGCPFDTTKDDEPDDPDPPEEFKERISPENLLHNLRVAYQQKEFEEYILLFAQDFTFVFDPRDANNDSLDIPDSWGLAEERDAHRDLFNAPDIEEIKLEWIPGSHQPPDRANADTKIIVRNIFLEVDQRLPNGEILYLQVRGDAWFHFRKSDVTTAEGDTIWEIVWWEDKSIL
jgi:hypothetical protein